MKTTKTSRGKKCICWNQRATASGQTQSLFRVPHLRGANDQHRREKKKKLESTRNRSGSSKQILSRAAYVGRNRRTKYCLAIINPGGLQREGKQNTKIKYGYSTGRAGPLRYVGDAQKMCPTLLYDDRSSTTVHARGIIIVFSAARSRY